MKQYLAFMAKYYPEGDKYSSFNVYGYITTQLLIQVLQGVRRRPHPRERVEAGHQPEERASSTCCCRVSRSTTTPTDYRVNKQLQMMRFDGERWEMFGPILEDKGAAG